MRVNVSTEHYDAGIHHVEQQVLASGMALIGDKQTPMHTEEMSDLTAKAVVQVFSTAEMRNVLQPWVPGRQRAGRGSGFVTFIVNEKSR